MLYRIGWHTDSDAGRIEPTGARTLKSAIARAKTEARRSCPRWDYRGYGPHWTVYDAGTGETLASGRL